MSTIEQQTVRWRPALVEVGTSLAALLAVAALFFNYLETALVFFGDTPETLPEHVTAYRAWLVTLALAVLGGAAAAVWRRGAAARSLWWHGVLAVVAVFSAVAFHVTTSPATDPRPVPDDSGGNHVCFSGGDSDECVGG